MKALFNTINRLITWGERKVRTDLRYILHGGSWLVTGQMVGVAAALLVAMGYAHFLTKETYGTYKYVISVLGILSLFTLPGMENGAQRGFAQNKDRVFWDTLKYRLMGGVVATIICGAIGVYYYAQGNLILTGVFLACAPFLILMEPLIHYNTILTGRKLFKQATIYGVILQLSTSITIFVTVYLTNSIFTLMLVYVSAAVLFRGALFTYALRHNTLNNVRDPDSVSYGAHMSFLNMLGTASSKLDAILLFHFLGPIPLAIYSFAQAVAMNVQSSFKLVTGALAFPKFASQDKKVVKRTLMRKIYLSHAVTIPIAVMAVILIPLLYRFLFPQYLESIIYAQVMTGILAFAPLRFVSTAIAALASTKIIYKVNVTAPVLQAIFLLSFVPFLGIWGIIMATICQQFIVNIVNVYYFKRM